MLECICGSKKEPTVFYLVDDVLYSTVCDKCTQHIFLKFIGAKEISKEEYIMNLALE